VLTLPVYVSKVDGKIGDGLPLKVAERAFRDKDKVGSFARVGDM
jgi:hypothetical protein